MINTPSTPWIAAFPALSGVTDDAWGEVVADAKLAVLPPQTVIVRRGDPCQNFILIVRGTIRVYNSSDTGRELTLYRAHGGEVCVLTLHNLLKGTDYAAEAVTEEEVQIVVIPKPAFDKALAQSVGFRNYILGTLAGRLNEVIQITEQVAFRGLDLRLACLLGQLSGQNSSATLQITHQELASELGTTREVVSRLLKDFERMGCISLRRGEIEVVSPAALNRLMQDDQT
jgi:CRP/FNR family transcriptional regulator